MWCSSPSILLDLPTPLKTCSPVNLLCSKRSILRKAAFREVFSRLGEKSQHLAFLELGQLVLYSPPNSSPLDLLSFGELKSLHLAFLSVIACIKITASADYSWCAQALHQKYKFSILVEAFILHTDMVFVSGICWLSGHQCYCRMCPWVSGSGFVLSVCMFPSN